MSTTRSMTRVGAWVARSTALPLVALFLWACASTADGGGANGGGGGGGSGGTGGTGGTGGGCGFVDQGSDSICNVCARKRCCAQGAACTADAACEACVNKPALERYSDPSCTGNAAFNAVSDCINDSRTGCGIECNPSCGKSSCTTNADCQSSACGSTCVGGVCK